jgi:hypothetical protein
LTSITIPESVTEIGNWIFEGCEPYVSVHPNNPVYTSVDGKLFTRFSLTINKNGQQ